MCCIFLKLDSLRYATLAESSIMNYWSQIFSTCRILIVFQNVTFRLRNRYFFSKNETPFPCQKSTPFWPENFYRVYIFQRYLYENISWLQEEIWRRNFSFSGQSSPIQQYAKLGRRDAICRISDTTLLYL